jgi:plastocyanin
LLVLAGIIVAIAIGESILWPFLFHTPTSSRGTPAPGHTASSSNVTQSPDPTSFNFGNPVDMTNQTSVTINIMLPPSGTACNPACYSPTNVKLKVGTTITWVNRSTTPHTVTAMMGENPGSETLAPQIFDSGASNLLLPGQSFTYKVTQAAYNFNKDHLVLYYCQIHPSMIAELTIVP